MKKLGITTPLIIEIRASKMLPGQIGLFAARKLKKNTIIAEASKLGEKFVSWADISKIDLITRSKIKHYCLQTEEGFYLPDDFNYISVPWNMNHSCGYNIGFDVKGNFITTRNIKKNEELFWDYGMGISYPKFRLECECGNVNCRKIISGNDWKNKKFVLNNKKYFLKELLQKAMAINN